MPVELTGHFLRDLRTDAHSACGSPSLKFLDKQPSDLVAEVIGKPSCFLERFFMVHICRSLLRHR
jgi:hypothetical protein